ncbi:MAG: bifunctional phosphoribosylaminoimidazolecarboxamide formyltransferase/IMP cyclohydrolase [Pseudomonadota bacterium]
MTDLISVRRALLSVSDKTGLIELAQSLHENGVELISTGGTAAALKQAGLSVTDVADITGFPEIMDGRVKTLHPMVHGGLLARRDKPAHLEAMDHHGIGQIDLLVVNLYPFEATVASGADKQSCIEQIDIGGPAMIRAAAKNHAFVTTLVDPQDYPALKAELDTHTGRTSQAFREKMALIAFGRTAAYDAAVSSWLASATGEPAPRYRVIAGERAQELRYGENPHQSAAFYTSGASGPSVATARQVQGKALSYNNINDTDAAFELVREFPPEDGPVCAIIKHANPCGVARGQTLAQAYLRAYDCDRTSAFGGIVALNQMLDADTAEEITQIFTEVVIAPGADEAARAIFAGKPNLRLLITDGLKRETEDGLAVKQVEGGLLVQDKDTKSLMPSDLHVATKLHPSEEQVADLLFAWTVAKHVKSNAIVYVRDGATVGIGAGQMSRVDSCRIAARKALDMAQELGLDAPLTEGSIVASDAFFPFADGLLTAAEAGALAVVQPGGSMRDDDVIKAADEAGLAMVLTGMRHFRH